MPRLAFLCLVLASQPVIGAEPWPLQFDIGPEWKVEYQGEGVDFFSLNRPRGESVFFTVSRWPVGGGLEQIPHYIDRMARGAQEKFASGPLFLLMSTDYEIEDIRGREYSGQAAVFANWDGTVQAIFMVSDGDGIWNGQFIGSRPMWKAAKRVLGTLARPIPPPDDRQPPIGSRLPER